MFFDSQGRIQGYWGLAISQMNHRFEVVGKTLCTWCTWDSLFLPEFLQTTAQVSSSCPVMGEIIRLRVRPDEIETVDPADTVVFFPRVERMTLGQDIVTNFCHFVHFFQSPEAASRWLEEHSGHLILSPVTRSRLLERSTLQYGELL